ncbi:GumC family protein [Agarivorans gilvus]|uniref:GumC family protein n=1 Tax=Agarivorans gilvus TaxID=680279 RepID=UPI0006EC1E3F|nr:GumC family protein [Agarivorans gilvus]
MTKASEQAPLNLSVYLTVLLKRSHYVVLVGFIVGALSYLLARTLPVQYSANATLLIEAQANKAVSIKDAYDFDTNKKEYYLTQFELLKSRALAEKVIDKLDLKHSPAFLAPSYPEGIVLIVNKAKALKSQLLTFFGLEEPSYSSTTNEPESDNQDLVKQLQSNLTISPIRKTQLVVISYQASTPQLAADIVNTLGQAYIESSLDVQTKVTQQAYFWLSDKVAELNSAVTLSETKLADFLESEKLVDSSGIDSLLNAELTRLTEQLAEVRNRRIAAASIDQLLKVNKNVSVDQLSTIPAISNHPQVRDIRVSQLETEKYVSELSKRYGPKHDKLIQAKAQLQALNQKAKQIISTLAQGIENELNSTKQQEITLKRELENKKSEFQEFTKKELATKL